MKLTIKKINKQHLIIIIAIVFGLFFYFHSDLNNPTLSFSDAELGIAFDYPEGWGSTLISIEADHKSLTQKISFTNQPNLYFKTISPALLSDVKNLQMPSSFFSMPTMTYYLNKFNNCVLKKEQIYSGELFLGEEFSNIHDIYDIHMVAYSLEDEPGFYEFLACPKRQDNITGIFYSVEKDRPDETTGLSIVKLSKIFSIKTQNPLYYPLEVYQNTSSGELKLQDCSYIPPEIPKCDKGSNSLISERIKDFDLSKFNKQTELVLKGMKINDVNIEDARKYFLNHFTDLVKYQGTNYSYLYPKILGLDHKEEKGLNTVRTYTREQMIQYEKRYEDCYDYHTCFPPYLTIVDWDNEKKFLESNPADGNINCIRANKGFRKSLCEVKTYGANKFLIRYAVGYGESILSKTYSIYKNDILYEISTPGKIVDRETNPIVFKDIENQLFQKIYEDIVNSLTFIDLQTTPKIEDKTADWQTYRNEKYGFEVKYPKSWEYQEAEIIEESNITEGVISFKQKDKTYYYSPGATIGQMDPISIEITIGTPEQIFGKIYPALATSIRKTINNYSIWFLTNAFGERFYVFESPIKQNIQITLRNKIDMLVKENNLERDELNNVFNQILSTFKFTK